MNKKSLLITTYGGANEIKPQAVGVVKGFRYVNRKYLALFTASTKLDLGSLYYMV